MKNKDGRTVGLVPLVNFAVIDKHYPLYRSAQPLHGYQYKWLSDILGVKLIVNLREETIDTRMTSGIGIGVVNFPVSDKKPPSLEIAHKFIDLIRETPHLPTLIHCEHGHGRTSTFSVLARLALGWDIKAAIREEEERFHYNFSHPAQKEFLLKNFSGTSEDKELKGEKIQNYA